jgi:hypothetical protein
MQMATGGLDLAVLDQECENAPVCRKAGGDEASMAIGSAINVRIDNRRRDLNGTERGDRFEYFFAGNGRKQYCNSFGGQSIHDFRATVAVFEKHPFIGRSLGGVSSRLSERLGVVNDGKTNLGFPVIMDVLTASGVIGFIPFLLFLGMNTIGLFPMILRRWPEERAKWLRVLVRATIYLWLVLSVDQNVLRIYLWFHMSIVAAVALHLRQRSDWVAEGGMLPQTSIA